MLGASHETQATRGGDGTEPVMGKTLMLQDADDARIESIKKRLRARTKIEVVRSALDLLERDAERAERMTKWRRTAGLVARESRGALRDFGPQSRLRRPD